MFFAGLAGMITKTIDKLMLGSMIDVEVVGIYTIILTFPILIQAVGSAFSMTGHAQISQFWQDDKRDKIQTLYRENVGIQMFLGLFLFGTFTVFGRPLLYFIGEEYSVAYTAFVLLMIGELVNISTGMCGGIIAYSKYYKFDFYTRIFLVLLTIISNLLFIPLWGLTGAAFATSLSLALYNITKVIFVKIKLGFFPYTGENIRLFFSALLFFSFLFFLQNYIQLENVVVIIIFSIFCFALYLVINKYLLKMAILKDLKHYLKR